MPPTLTQLVGPSRTWLTIVALLLANAAQVLAQNTLPASPAEYLALMDLDSDSRVNLGEYRDYMSRGFRRMDADGNDVLEGTELPVPDARRVWLADHLAALSRAFARQDHNGDGALDSRELAAPPR